MKKKTEQISPNPKCNRNIIYDRYITLTYLYNDKTISLKQMDNKRDPKPLVQFTLYFHFDRFMFHDT